MKPCSGEKGNVTADVSRSVRVVSCLNLPRTDSGGGDQSKWTKGSILTKFIGTYKSEMPGNSAGNYVTLHEF